MSPRIPALAPLLGGLLACQAFPTDMVGSAAQRRTAEVAPAALAAIRDAVEDPLLRALVAGLSDEASRQQVGRALNAVSRAATHGQSEAIDDALYAAREQAARSGAADDQVARAAFALLLDHVAALLHDGPDAELTQATAREEWR